MIRYAITDVSRRSFGPAERSAELLISVRRWAAAGVDYIQLREKSLAAGELFCLAEKLTQELQQAGGRSRLLVNGRPDVALASDCGGVHLTGAAGELTPAQIGELFACHGLPRPVVSMSCHDLRQAVDAGRAGADLILFGPVFEKVVGDAFAFGGRGLEELAAAANAVGNTPVLALGGVTDGNTPECLAVGAAGVAGIRLFG